MADPAAPLKSSPSKQSLFIGIDSDGCVFDRMEIERVYAWSLDVNEAVETTVRDFPPFPLFRESPDSMGKKGDTIVVSQTPGEALVSEWKEHDID